MSEEVARPEGTQTPEGAVVAVTPTPEPTPVVGVTASSPEHPPGTAMPDASDRPAVIGPPDKPEIAVGAAFAGGFALALILKRITS